MQRCLKLLGIILLASVIQSSFAFSNPELSPRWAPLLGWMPTRLCCGYSNSSSILLWPTGDAWSNTAARSVRARRVARAAGPVGDQGFSGNCCCGYFWEPPAISAYTTAAPFNTTQMTITVTGPSTFAQQGPSVLTGNVALTQPGREIAADKAIIYRNLETGKFSEIELQGNVHYREPGKLLVAQSSELNLEEKTLSFSQGAYNAKRPTRYGLLYSWGLLSQGYRNAQGTLFLRDATYTTCSPLDPSWYLASNNLTLNKVTGRGVARDTWLYAGNIPVMYTPYANFPIDNRRYSGFLYPSFAFDNDSGFSVDIPYYFNLAPNYDDTLTLTPMTKRGVMATNLFRYLFPGSRGNFILSFIPNDRGFAHFKQETFEDFPPSFLNDPYLDQLAKDSNNRAAVALHDLTTFNENWMGTLDINYVTDDYFLKNFGVGPQQITTDQLLNQAQVTYQDEHWQFLAQLQGYQTLHLIDDTFIAEQYRRLPQIDFAANYPALPLGLDFGFSSEWVNFQHLDDFFTGQEYPTGNRVHLNPMLSRPLLIKGGYITPTLQLDSTTYGVVNNAVVDNTNLIPIFFPTDEKHLNLTRALPMFDIDTGIFLDRGWHLGSHQYRQTLEPRLYYLYVPLRNQLNIPLFDTTLPTFSTDTLFRPNRFVGYDRVGDANQLAVGITSRILDGFTGENKLEATVGEIFYFHNHEVCLYPNCSDDPTINDSVSPVAGMLTFRPNAKWTGTATASWDPNQSQLNNAGAHLVYSPAPQHIFKLGYDYLQNGDVLNPAEPNSHENNLHRLDVGLAWPLTQHWNLMADWNYNLSHKHPQTYLYGLEYDTCCWSLRFVANRTITNQNNEGQASYRTDFYVQFMLKGLGTIGTSNAGNVLMTTFPGYFDKYRG